MQQAKTSKPAPRKVQLPAIDSQCYLWFNGRKYTATVCALYSNRIGVTFMMAGREQLRIVKWQDTIPVTIPRGTPAFAFPSATPVVCAHEDTTLECPFDGSAVDPDTQICSRCDEAVAPVRRCRYCEQEVAA